MKTNINFDERKQKTYRFMSKILFVFIILFSCFDAFSAECYKYYYTSDNEAPSVNFVVYRAEFLPVDTCTETIHLSGLEYAKLKTLEEQFGGEFAITSEDIAISFTWGFGTYLGFWWLAYVIRTAKKTIRIL